MVNYCYTFKTQFAAAIATSKMTKILKELGYEGDWINMAHPYGMTQRSPTHKEFMSADGSTRRAPYMEIGGINQDKNKEGVCVSLRSITHISEEHKELLTSKFDEIIIKFENMTNDDYIFDGYGGVQIYNDN